MEKKEFLKAAKADFEPKSSGVSIKLSGASQKAFGVIKFILGVSLLPLVYSSTTAFLNEFNTVEKPLQDAFWSGIVVFLAVYLFIWEPAVIYYRGQRLLEIIFTFFKPLVRVAPYLLPIYAIVLFLLYWPVSLLVRSGDLLPYFIFLFGFSIGLHLVFSAKVIRGKKEDFLKANYLFGFSFIYILNLVLFAAILNMLFAKFSFVNFLNNAALTAQGIFSAVFRQLFLR